MQAILTIPRAAALAVLGLLTSTAWTASVAADSTPYPNMAPVAQYRMARADEITLAKSAAPASLSDHAEIMVMGEHSYETAVQGSNGFVCLVTRSWDEGFARSDFWNQKIRAPQCFNKVAAAWYLPYYTQRTEWVLAGVAKDEMQRWETAAIAGGKMKALQPGAVVFMMSKQGYLGDDAQGPWHPHIMFFMANTPPSAWGANLDGDPVAATTGIQNTYDNTPVFFIVVPHWSDGTPVPAMTDGM